MNTLEKMIKEQLEEPEEQNILELDVTNQLKSFTELTKGIIARFVKDVILQEAATWEVGESKFCMLNKALLNALKDLINSATKNQNQINPVLTGLDYYVGKIAKLAYKCWLEETIERIQNE